MSCRYYFEKDPAAGECRKRPPTMFVIPATVDTSRQLIGGEAQVRPAQLTSCFPGVRKDTFCGEWSSKEAQ